MAVLAEEVLVATYESPGGDRLEGTLSCEREMLFKLKSKTVQNVRGSGGHDTRCPKSLTVQRNGK